MKHERVDRRDVRQRFRAVRRRHMAERALRIRRDLRGRHHRGAERLVLVQDVQLGAGVWRVPDLTGSTRRVDVSITPVWRYTGAHGYIEGGFGAYVLSKTVNNDTTSLPTSFQFGSHVGTGLALKNASVGVAFQHLSNAGIKQPNGGINFYLATVSLEL